MEKTKTKGFLLICFLIFIFFLSSFFVSANDNIQLEDLLQSIVEEKTVILDAYTFINIGNFFMHQTLYEPARDEYQKALESDPSNTMALINLSYTLFKLEDYNQVLDLLNQLNCNDTNNVFAYYIKGLIYKELRDLDKAIEQYEKVVELIPNHQQLNAELAQLYLDDHQLIKANDKFLEMSYCKPRPNILEKLTSCKVNAYCYLHLGNYYRNNDELEKAKQAYEKATQFEDDKRSIALAYFYQGEINLKEHKYDRTIIEKKLAQRIYPLGDHNFTFDTFAEAFVEVGDIYYHRGDLPEAFKYYELATNMANAQDILSLAHYKKGLTYYRNQDYNNALREAETALSLNPDYLSDRQRLIDLLIANSWSRVTKK